ncbi:hypothetical protein CsSME_00033176 [Camellia sinensis var. sinensis]
MFGSDWLGRADNPKTSALEETTEDEDDSSIVSEKWARALASWPLVLDRSPRVPGWLLRPPEGVSCSIQQVLRVWRAVAVNSKLQYAVVEVHALLGDASTSPGDRKKRLGNVLKEQNKPFLIIASDLLSTLEAKWGTKLVVKKILMGSDLEHCKHKYPYDWRCTKKPTIFRATEQWFASVKGFREAAMDAISQVTSLLQKILRFPCLTNAIIILLTLFPKCTSIFSHSDRCISRQRTWGVPIPVFYHVESKEPLLNEDTINHIQSIICQKGSDAWWYMTVNELLPDVYRDKASEYEKGTDTMDAWFDSGIII